MYNYSVKIKIKQGKKVFNHLKTFAVKECAEWLEEPFPLILSSNTF